MHDFNRILRLRMHDLFVYLGVYVSLAPAINVDVGAPSVAQSTHTNRAGALERLIWLTRVHTLPAVSQHRNGLQTLLVVVLSPQVVQCP